MKDQRFDLSLWECRHFPNIFNALRNREWRYAAADYLVATDNDRIQATRVLYDGFTILSLSNGNTLHFPNPQPPADSVPFIRFTLMQCRVPFAVELLPSGQLEFRTKNNMRIDPSGLPLVLNSEFRMSRNTFVQTMLKAWR